MVNNVFCLLTDSHLERAVFFGTLSWSQDELLLQNDSATETPGLRILQESLRPRRWTQTTCNNETLHHWLPIENRLSWPVMCHSGSYLPGTLWRSTAKPGIVVALVAGLSVSPLTHRLNLTTGEDDWEKNVKWLLSLITLFLKCVV